MKYNQTLGTIFIPSSEGANQSFSWLKEGKKFVVPNFQMSRSQLPELFTSHSPV